MWEWTQSGDVSNDMLSIESMGKQMHSFWCSNATVSMNGLFSASVNPYMDVKVSKLSRIVTSTRYLSGVIVNVFQVLHKYSMSRKYVANQGPSRARVFGPYDCQGAPRRVMPASTDYLWV
jgi:hypothetical protein